MSNVATKWYYEGYDECSFESPQAPGAAQVRVSYHREARVDQHQALSGPTGIGRRRLNDNHGLADASGGNLTASINAVYRRPTYGAGGLQGQRSSSAGLGGAARGGNKDRRVDTTDALTQRLRYENLILQHKADHDGHSEKQRALTAHMRERLAEEEALLAAEADGAAGDNDSAHLMMREPTSGVSEDGDPSAEGAEDAPPPRPLTPLGLKAQSINERHERLLAMRAAQRAAPLPSK